MANEPDQWKFDIPTHASSIEAGSKPQPVKSATKQGTRNRLWVALAISGLLLSIAGFMFGSQIIRIATGKGQIIIESDDPNVEIEVLQNGEQIKILDTATNQSIDFHEGTYHFRPVGTGNSITIEPNHLVLSRGGKEIVRVSVENNESANLARNPIPKADFDNPEVASIRSDIRALEVDISQLSQQYGPHHPDVIERTQRLRLYREQLIKLSPDTELINSEFYTQPLFKGKPLAHWAHLAVRERALSRHGEIVESLTTLADDSTAGVTLPALIQLFRQSWRYEYIDFCRQLPIRISADTLLSTITTEVQDGNATSRAAMTTLLSFASDRQNQSFRNAILEWEGLTNLLSSVEDFYKSDSDWALRSLVTLYSLTEADTSTQATELLVQSIESSVEYASGRHVPEAAAILIGHTKASPQLAKKLGDCLSQSQSQERDTIYPLLRKMDENAEASVPYLVKLIDQRTGQVADYNNGDTTAILDLLSSIGPGATDAIPVLKKLKATSGFGRYRNTINQTIRSIDPNEAEPDEASPLKGGGMGGPAAGGGGSADRDARSKKGRTSKQ